MSIESFTIERRDHHILPWRKPDVASLPAEKGRVSVEEIGAASITHEIKGHLTGVAKLFRGVVVVLPDLSEHTIEPLPSSPCKDEPISLKPQQTITFIRQRFAKGKTEIVLTNTST